MDSPVDIETILASNCATVHRQIVEGRVLAVRENEQYRWFEFGGQAVQSLMEKARPERIVTPVAQALLLFLLFDHGRSSVLNLGMGGASIERAVAAIPTVSVTSVEACEPIIDIARAYFHLPKAAHIVCERAERYVEKTQARYDVVLCDLFLDESTPAFLGSEEFYSRLTRITTDRVVVLLNIQADTEEELLQMLRSIRRHLPHIALLEFTGYRNIVIVCSPVEIPSRETLLGRLGDSAPLAGTSLRAAIEAMRYVPWA